LPRYLGDASYSIYLFHIFAVAGVWAIAKRIFDVQHPLIYAMGAALACWPDSCSVSYATITSSDRCWQPARSGVAQYRQRNGGA